MKLGWPLVAEGHLVSGAREASLLYCPAGLCWWWLGSCIQTTGLWPRRACPLPSFILFYLEPAPDHVLPSRHFGQTLAQSGCRFPGLNSESWILRLENCLSISAASPSIDELYLQVEQPKGVQGFKKKIPFRNFSAKLVSLISVSSQGDSTVSQAGWLCALTFASTFQVLQIR